MFLSGWCRLTRSGTNARMVTKSVTGALAEGARGVRIRHRQAKPQANHGPKERGHHVKPQGGACEHGATPPRLLAARAEDAPERLPDQEQGPRHGLLLSDRLRGWDREVVGRRKGHVHQVESSIEVRVVARIHIFAQWRSSPQRSSVAGDTVPGHAAEPEPTTPSGECCLEPRFRTVRGPLQATSRQPLPALSNASREGPSPSGGVTLMGVSHPTMGGTVAEEQEGSLGIRQDSQSV